ncbi:MAG: hypothetical protein JWM44_3588 [Bacilli bacterium]|nr:hypothetical protein [Bacilli bacterium]
MSNEEENKLQLIACVQKMATRSNGCACKVESFALAKMASEAYACADFEMSFHLRPFKKLIFNGGKSFRKKTHFVSMCLKHIHYAT